MNISQLNQQMTGEALSVGPADWARPQLETVLDCTACGSSNASLLHSDLTDQLFGTNGVWNLHLCHACGSGFLSKRLREKFVGEAYKSYYTHGTTNAPGKSSQGVAGAVWNAYLNRKYGTSRAPSLPALWWLAKAVPGKASYLGWKMRVGRPDVAGARLLDVGCGSGEYLGIASEMGWTAIGLDFDTAAVETCRSQGFEAIVGDVTNTRLPGGFSAITLSHVIEHVYDPASVLRACWELLCEGGVLWIDTPNMRSLGHDLFGRNWRGLEPPRHITVFSNQALKTMLRSCGFQSIIDLPWAPHREEMFRISRAIANGAPDPSAARATKGQRLLWRIEDAVFQGHPERSEFITLSARKSVAM